ncbi:hypothetical protein C7457_1674 [Thermovibrio guaymasensis]|uniref:Uncharacterized protein n=1 Tax=Thermovibrio guaymasensis TaxID=240167 RepID=A0A420W5E5_9BACT|nr:hypothetical protein [Thermovibrio guaymasensis]RKQ59889.1 hypothetical protein C7457_1674 [Thermovibrio guaymasensis]
MDIEEIRKNKPEGATHYLELGNRGVIFFKAKWLDILVLDSREGWRKIDKFSGVKWLFGWWYNDPDGLYVHRIKPL